MIDYSVIKKTMQSFSFGSLKSFLGEDLVDSLIEWTQEGESVYTKAKLTQLILTVKGLRLLKEKDFRKQLLLHYKPDKKLYDFYMNLVHYKINDYTEDFISLYEKSKKKILFWYEPQKLDKIETRFISILIFFLYYFLYC